jgi:hypothetical protein
MSEQITHDRLQSDAFLWAHNTIPQIRGRLFAVLNEIKPYPGESKQAHIRRISQAKAIGLQSGALDLLFMAPGNEAWKDGDRTVFACAPAIYGFDAKIGRDKIHDKQIDFVQILQDDGGNGYPFYSLDEFKSIFIHIIRKHYGPII